ncbi:Hsp20 family protein [Mesorhizobium sp. ES1-3]|uniref:Hsp20 family protein n=1 Tax=Mesorhizobium sp. ES1-3 TaxID=2876628 RepID=UPI001CCA7E23|nr:Hsp20 family protein [Mesorhizobium sp. ES1-3]MBZ9673745.1 Hsp20 family protein [Mesorhizobium sp. ES1-3]
MRTAFDFTPLFRSSIGFDRIVDMLENASRVTTVDNWPHYDIVKTNDDDYRITMAVAGFTEDELAITQEPNMLLVAGHKAEDDAGDYLYRGIAGRAFQRRFELADHVKIVGANLANGLLTINVRREIPEEMKPRRIEIASSGPARKVETTKQIEADKADAGKVEADKAKASKQAA